MGLAKHLEAVADPKHEPTFIRELDDRRHRGSEARNRTRAQVVAVREASRHHDRVSATKVAVRVPDQLGVANELSGLERVNLIAGARELKDTEPHRSVATASASAGSMRSKPGIPSKP